MIKCKKGQVAIEPIYDSDYYNPSSQLIKIPEIAKDRCDQGIVKYMGSEVDPAITIGSHVIFSGYTGTNLRIDGEILIIMHSKFIKAIVSEEDNIVSGLYFKGRVNADRLLNDLSFSFGKDQVIYQLLAEYQSRLIIPATYEESIRFIADSRTVINVKKEELKSQRDEFDEDMI